MAVNHDELHFRIQAGKLSEDKSPIQSQFCNPGVFCCSGGVKFQAENKNENTTSNGANRASRSVLLFSPC